MIGREPIPQRRRHQETLLTVTFNEVLGHPRIPLNGPDGTTLCDSHRAKRDSGRRRLEVRRVQRRSRLSRGRIPRAGRFHIPADVDVGVRPRGPSTGGALCAQIALDLERDLGAVVGTPAWIEGPMLRHRGAIEPIRRRSQHVLQRPAAGHTLCLAGGVEKATWRSRAAPDNSSARADMSPPERCLPRPGGRR